MTNSAEPDQLSWLLQKPTDLDLHCLQRQGIYAGPGLKSYTMCILINALKSDDKIQLYCVIHILVYFHRANNQFEDLLCSFHLES